MLANMLCEKIDKMVAYLFGPYAQIFDQIVIPFSYLLLLPVQVGSF